MMEKRVIPDRLITPGLSPRERWRGLFRKGMVPPGGQMERTGKEIEGGEIRAELLRRPGRGPASGGFRMGPEVKILLSIGAMSNFRWP